MRQKKQYPVWDNYRYAFYHMRKKEGMGSIVLCVFDAVCGILLPFLEAALAGAMAACLVSGKRPQEILLVILGYVVILQGVRGVGFAEKAAYPRELILLGLREEPNRI